MSPAQHVPLHAWFTARHATHVPPEHVEPAAHAQSAAQLAHVSVPLHVPSPHDGGRLHTGFDDAPHVSPASQREP